MRTLAVYGGVSMNKQLDTLRHGVDIVVATPGRLMDHMRRHTIDLKAVEVLVLDEADRMFDMGFIADVQKIVAAVPTQRQTMLFSATIPPEVQRLAAGIQQSPLLIEIGEQNNPVETITQCVHAVAREQKLDLLRAHAPEQADVLRAGLLAHQARGGQDSSQAGAGGHRVRGDPLRPQPVAAATSPRRLQGWQVPGHGRHRYRGSRHRRSRDLARRQFRRARTTRRITSTGSAAPDGPPPQATPSRSSRPTRESNCPGSSGSSAARSGWRNTRASPVPISPPSCPKARSGQRRSGRSSGPARPPSGPASAAAARGRLAGARSR